MTIVKWSPFRDLDLVERRLRRMLEDTGFGAPFVPAADVYETKDEFVVELGRGGGGGHEAAPAPGRFCARSSPRGDPRAHR